MDAVPECNMEIGFAGDVESARVRELMRVAVCGTDQRQHERSGGNRLAMHLDVASWRAHDPLQGRAEAQNLFDGEGQKVGRFRKARELLRVLDKAQNRIVDQI